MNIIFPKNYAYPVTEDSEAMGVFEEHIRLRMLEKQWTKRSEPDKLVHSKN